MEAGWRSTAGRRRLWRAWWTLRWTLRWTAVDATGPPSLPSPADYREAGRVGSSSGGDRSLGTVTSPRTSAGASLTLAGTRHFRHPSRHRGMGVMQPPCVWLLSELELRFKNQKTSANHGCRLPTPIHVHITSINAEVHKFQALKRYGTQISLDMTLEITSQVKGDSRYGLQIFKEGVKLFKGYVCLPSSVTIGRSVRELFSENPRGVHQRPCVGEG